MARLPARFYRRDNVVEIARALIGKVLVTNINNQITSGVITETEAYHESEKACHAYNGKRTARTEILFQAGGCSYVYLCYGIHNLFNVVTGKKGEAAAVLIRALKPLNGLETMLRRRNLNIAGPRVSAGPGMLSQALGLTLKHNRASLTRGRHLWIENGRDIHDHQIGHSQRIGVDYAGEDAILPWRFFLTHSQWLSK